MDIQYIATLVSQDNYLAGITVFLAIFLISGIFKKIVLFRLKQIASKTKTDVDDLMVELIEKIGWPFYFAFGTYFGIAVTDAPLILKDVAYGLVVLAGVYYVSRIIGKVIDYTLKKYGEKRGDRDSSLLELIANILKATVWMLAIIIVLQNYGFEISALIAGLGVGGIAVAFAVQNILSDIFSSFSIYFDKPFKKGDFIVVGDDSGTVERIGLKSTRIRTLQGEELIVSNKELTEARIHNYKRMKKRAVIFRFGVAYETPTAKLGKIPKIVKNIFDGIELAQLSRVHFKEMGDFSLIYEVMYYVNTSDYVKYLDIQQNVNIELKKRFEKERIEFAYPTQTIFLKKYSA